MTAHEARDPRFKHCPYCAQTLSPKTLTGRERQSCPCGYVQFLNPIAGVAAIVRDDAGRVLLCHKPKEGGWAFPGGYVEWDEEIRHGLRREFHEETGMTIEVGDVVAVESNFDRPEKQSVGVWFAARITGGEQRLDADEIDRLEYFALDATPEMAFPTDQRVIELLRE